MNSLFILSILTRATSTSFSAVMSRITRRRHGSFFTLRMLAETRPVLTLPSLILNFVSKLLISPRDWIISRNGSLSFSSAQRFRSWEFLPIATERSIPVAFSKARLASMMAPSFSRARMTGSGFDSNILRKRSSLSRMALSARLRRVISWKLSTMPIKLPSKPRKGLAMITKSLTSPWISLETSWVTSFCPAAISLIGHSSVWQWSPGRDS